jgi:hypothetical protein
MLHACTVSALQDYGVGCGIFGLKCSICLALLLVYGDMYGSGLGITDTAICSLNTPKAYAVA